MGSRIIYDTFPTYPESLGRSRGLKYTKNPAKLKSPSKRRNQNKYCRYHKDHGHDSKDCFKMKVTIAKLIEKGHLTEFVTNNN